MILVVLGTVWAIVVPGAAIADRGVDLFVAGDDVGARRAFEARLDATPEDAVALYYLGRLTPEDGLAARHFERLLEVAPDDSLADDARLALAESAYASPLGLFKTARRHYRRLIEDYPRSEHRHLALYRLGKTFVVTGEPDSASVYFSQVLEAGVGDLRTFARFGEAEALRQAGKQVTQPDADPVYPFASGRAGPSPMATNDEGSAYWIQAGAFRREEGARVLAERLRIAKLSVEQHRNSRGLIVLRVGPFPSREEAVRIVRHLKDVEHIDAMVIAP